MISDPLPIDTLSIIPWTDPVIDSVGHDPRSPYVEQFWLGILGPSTTWLLRRLATCFESSPAGFELPLADTARSLGLSAETAKSSFFRSLSRACQFGMAHHQGGGNVAVRRRVPPLNLHQVSKLPKAVQREHRRWQEAELATPAVEARRRRAKRLALSLLELGEDTEATEIQLHRWRYHPAMAREAVAWALDRRRPDPDPDPEPDPAA